MAIRLPADLKVIDPDIVFARRQIPIECMRPDSIHGVVEEFAVDPDRRTVIHLQREGIDAGQGNDQLPGPGSAEVVGHPIHRPARTPREIDRRIHPGRGDRFIRAIGEGVVRVIGGEKPRPVPCHIGNQFQSGGAGLLVTPDRRHAIGMEDTLQVDGGIFETGLRERLPNLGPLAQLADLTLDDVAFRVQRLIPGQGQRLGGTGCRQMLRGGQVIGDIRQ